MMPCPRPKYRNVFWKPSFLIIAWIGATVSAEPAPKVATVQVLVANGTVAPGTKLSADMVRWQDWPKASVEASLTTHETVPDLPKFLSDAVARMPLVAGQPITESNVVHSESAGFMAATYGRPRLGQAPGAGQGQVGCCVGQGDLHADTLALLQLGQAGL